MLSQITVLSALISLSSVILAAPQPRALAEVVTTCTTPNTVALTFDDGPWIYAYEISDVLKAAGANGTFFYNGNNYACIYDDEEIKRVKHVFANGHQVASHTWSHDDLTTLTFDQLHDEMWRVEQALERIVGVAPAFMRPPFGNYNNLVREVAAARGQEVVIWDFDSGDSVGATVQKSKQEYDAAIKPHPKTILTLNHETIETTARQVLPYAISQLQAAGYRLVTLAECLGKQPYQWTTAPGVKDASWKC
ncbi:carbohydrate esterase family 4 protein [Pterulicium gracile]|uniref:Carbohydrate esterase family 4 protein n=1 Tax=Pterulicium gracile TaxID=1884261 RepID=A0A5C3QYU1_9AGAR|nr:carbohydrate esterase family 4 protein [Pterula gracilis]